MKTLCLTIIHKEVPYQGYYLPAIDGFKVGFRSENTKINALKKIARTIKKNDFIQSFIIEEYEGNYDYYNKTPLLCSYTSDDLSDYGIDV